MGGLLLHLVGLEVTVEVEGVVAALAPDPADSGAAEGRGEVAHQESSSPRPCPRARPRPKRSAFFWSVGEDHGRESVGGGVGQRDRFVLTREGLEGQHRSEDLVLDDLGVVGSRLDECRLVPEAVRRGALAAEDERVARRERALHEALDPREVLGVDEGRDGRRRIATVAEDVHARSRW